MEIITHGDSEEKQDLDSTITACGHWNYNGEVYECSVCDFETITSSKRCPYCNTWMRQLYIKESSLTEQ